MCGWQTGPPPQSRPDHQVPPPGGAPPYPSPYPYQYYPGQPPYGQPQPPRDDSLKKVIICVVIFIVIIAVVTVIASIIFLGITTSFEEPPGMIVTINLASPLLEEGVRNGTSVWDATLFFNKVTPIDARVGWSSIRVMVRAPTGVVLLDQTPMVADTGTYDESSPISIEVWYTETMAGGVTASAGDFIKITGMTVAFEGAMVQFYSQGQLIGSATLPTNFP
jgi:hypothetical protein